MKKNKYLLIFSILLNLIMGAYCAKKVYFKYRQKKVVAEAVTAPKNEKVTYFLKRNELFAKLSTKSNAVLFVGNSLTQNFEVNEFFVDHNILNRGINGDIVKGVINRLEPIVNSNPSKIFLEIGINDLGHGMHKDTVLHNYRKLIIALKKNAPNCKVYVNSIFPTSSKSNEMPSYCGLKINNEIRAINTELEKICTENNYTFIEVNKAFSKGKFINPIYTVDGVHLSYEGYLLWAKILNPYLKQK